GLYGVRALAGLGVGELVPSARAGRDRGYVVGEDSPDGETPLGAERHAEAEVVAGDLAEDGAERRVGPVVVHTVTAKPPGRRDGALHHDHLARLIPYGPDRETVALAPRIARGIEVVVEIAGGDRLPHSLACLALDPHDAP